MPAQKSSWLERKEGRVEESPSTAAAYDVNVIILSLLTEKKKIYKKIYYRYKLNIIWMGGY